MSGLGLPMAQCPEEIGLSAERLERIRKTLREDVERQLIPGAVMLIARGGRIGFAEAVGFRDREAGAPMTLDAIVTFPSPDSIAVSRRASRLRRRFETWTGYVQAHSDRQPW